MAFAYNLQQISALEATLSSDRLARYVAGAAGDKKAALKLYVFNTQVSEAFYAPLQGLEICLRNAIGAQLRAAYGANWYDAGRVPALDYPLPDMLAKAATELALDRKPMSHGGIVAQLNFGFWVTILSPRYEPIWRRALRRAFPRRPRGTERHHVHGALNAIRRLRNRVAHHEPILHRNLVSDHTIILRALSWMCADTAAWVAAHSRVPQVLATGP